MSGIDSVTSMIHVVGLGVETGARLSEPADQALLSAMTVIGSNRQLELARGLTGRQDSDAPAMLTLPKLSELKALIEELPEGPVVILASGDPLFFGIGRWLGQQFDSARLVFHPSLSSIQAVCNRLGIAQQDCEVISLHGRALGGLRRVLKQNKTIIVLTDKHSHPQALAQACLDSGFEQSRIQVCEDLGSKQERYRDFGVSELLRDTSFECSKLHVSVIRTLGRGAMLPEFPGIADQAFATDGEPGQGMFTKREVRLAILSLLQPSNEDVIWDIGAGCGGVATELAHWNARVTVYAIEQHPERLACLAENQARFGTVGNLHIVDGRAPEILGELVDANKVFVGGNDGELESILETAWSRLPMQGLLVASSVTESTFAQLQAFAMRLDPGQVETLRLAVSRGLPTADGFDYQAKLPVTLFKFIKPGVTA